MVGVFVQVIDFNVKGGFIGLKFMLQYIAQYSSLLILCKEEEKYWQ